MVQFFLLKKKREGKKKDTKKQRKTAKKMKPPAKDDSKKARRETGAGHPAISSPSHADDLSQLPSLAAEIGYPATAVDLSTKLSTRSPNKMAAFPKLSA